MDTKCLFGNSYLVKTEFFLTESIIDKAKR